jgi:hypothetical protein
VPAQVAEPARYRRQVQLVVAHSGRVLPFLPESFFHLFSQFRRVLVSMHRHGVLYRGLQQLFVAVGEN